MSTPGFKSEDSLQQVEKQISDFIDDVLALPDGKKVLDELKALMVAGRGQVGWKQFGRMMLEALQ
ncbi:MAG TPA: hypothetical protein VK457_17020 [Chloroflexota bacterium]|jgi:hypothetical protein|nr:hypothetical protein [Chloroflexota bacterium]